jgi:hypothetical protein
VTSWLLDTNILSELRCPKPERKVVAFIAAQPLDVLYVSTVTLAEIRFGIELLPEVSLRADLADCWWKREGRPVIRIRSPTCSSQLPPCIMALPLLLATPRIMRRRVCPY